MCMYIYLHNFYSLEMLVYLWQIPSSLGTDVISSQNGRRGWRSSSSEKISLCHLFPLAELLPSEFFSQFVHLEWCNELKNASEVFRKPGQSPGGPPTRVCFPLSLSMGTSPCSTGSQGSQHLIIRPLVASSVQTPQEMICLVSPILTLATIFQVRQLTLKRF